MVYWESPQLPKTSRKGQRRELQNGRRSESCRMEKIDSKWLMPDLYRPQLGQKHLSQSMALRENNEPEQPIQAK